jgi:hypothetical protein
MHPGEIVDGRFRITVAAASTGGASVVHRALDLSSNQDVAIKVLDPSVDDARLDREIRLLEVLNEPRIVGYLARGTTADGERYLAMPWIDGVTIAKYSEVVGLTMNEALEMARNIALAMEAAHRIGVVHRDLKPANVLLERGRPERPFIIDFGIASGVGSRRLTRTGTLLGTPSYMAPEQARGSRDIDHRCDIFALGCLLYEVITGARAFAGSSELAIRTKTLLVTPSAPHLCNDQIALPISEFVLSMLAKQPSDRPNTMDTVADFLARHQASADGPRIKSHHDAASPTAAPGTLRLDETTASAALFLAVNPDVRDGEKTGEDWRSVATICARHQGEARPMLGASLLALFSGPDAITRAGRAALEVAVESKSLALGVAMLSASAPSEVIDRCARAIHAELRRNIGQHTTMRVRVLEPLPSRLPDSLTLLREGRRTYLEEVT